jgi:hypothetical protein
MRHRSDLTDHVLVPTYNDNKPYPCELRPRAYRRRQIFSSGNRPETPSQTTHSQVPSLSIDWKWAGRLHVAAIELVCSCGSRGWLCTSSISRNRGPAGTDSDNMAANTKRLATMSRGPPCRANNSNTVMSNRPIGPGVLVFQHPNHAGHEHCDPFLAQTLLGLPHEYHLHHPLRTHTRSITVLLVSLPWVYPSVVLV